ncbi:MAG TPA: PAS domain S-box protein [Firmicutes bacterium]|nr:PAS domain S-box protein [Bacillota bacterium]
MEIVTTIEGKCKRCYSCIRNCPVKAIKVENGQAKVVPELCIACGHCVRVCSQNAKRIQDDTGKVAGFFGDRDRAEGEGEIKSVIAALAPSFVAEFPRCSPGQVVAAARKLGFDAVYEVAWGADRVTWEYVGLLKKANRARGIISTPCPAIVNLVEKRYPNLIPRLAPVVSPMIALGRMIKARTQESNGGEVKIVFIGPCVAKKSEIADENVRDAVDAVITFQEFRKMLGSAGINPEALEPAPFDGPEASLGRLYPVSGGLLKSAALRADMMENDIIVVEGKDNCLEFLDLLSRGAASPEFVDMLFCEGCINGPMMTSPLVGYVRRKVVVDFAKKGQGKGQQQENPSFPEIVARRTYNDKSVKLPVPNEADIQRILWELNKTRPEDELNCGACGYNTCREKAIAVYRGLAENKMCLPYLISELEKTNEEIAALRDYNRNIVESITEGIIVVDRNCMITTFNDAGGRVSALSGGRAVVGRYLPDALPGLGTEEFMNVLKRTIRQAQPAEITGFRYGLQERDVIVNIKIYPLRNGTSNVHGAVIITEDVTEKKRLEDKLAQSDKLAALGQLAAGVAHEINTPLTLISGYTELLLNELKGEGAAAKRLGIIAEEVDRIAEIVRSLLSFARPAPRPSEKCKVNEAIRRTLSLVERQMAYRGIELIVNLATGEPDPEVLADQGELEQVFLNIVLNAIQAMRNGGRLVVATRVVPEQRDSVSMKSGSEPEPELESELELGPEPKPGPEPGPQPGAGKPGMGAGRRLEIEFTDTGCGIPEENLGKIFDPFFTTKDVGQGTGLGLSVSYGIVKKYGGSIRVTSKVNKGSTFIVELPISK